MNTARSLLVALVLGLWTLPPCVSSAAPSSANTNDQETVTRVTLEVDHSGLLKEQPPYAADPIAHWVREDVQKALRDTHGLEVVDDPNAAALIVRVGWADYPKSVYHVEIAIRKPGEDAVTVTTIDQYFLQETDMSKATAERLPEAIAELTKPASSDEPAPESDVVEPTDDTEPTDRTNNEPESAPDDGDTQAAPLSAKGKAGIGLLAAGAVGLGVGVGLIVVDERLDQENIAPHTFTGRQYRPPGIGISVGGGVLAATGAVLLILDRVAAKKQPRATGLRVVPSPSGFAIAGRF